MSFDMPYKTGGGSPWSFPTIPAPLKDDGLVVSHGNRIPHKGLLVDNIWVKGDTQGGYTGFLGKTQVWVVTRHDIDEKLYGFVGRATSCWYDSVNDRLYVFGYRFASDVYTFYTAYITLETGTVINIGAADMTVTPTTLKKNTDMTVSRATIDSGDFTLTFSDRTIVLDELTGAELSNVASANTTEAGPIGSYATLDGAIHLGGIKHVSASNGTLHLTRKQKTVTMAIPDNLFCTASELEIILISWGDKVKTHAGTAGAVPMLRTFLRTEFDTWLHKVADYGGLA